MLNGGPVGEQRWYDHGQIGDGVPKFGDKPTDFIIALTPLRKKNKTVSRVRLGICQVQGFFFDEACLE